MKNNRGRTFLFWIGGIVLCILGLLAVGYIYEPFAENADAKAYPPPGRMVDVGGYRLHFNCKGSGSPTVIIEAGLGDWSASWKNVQDKVGKVTQVCTYDRAGMGWSDAGPEPRNAKQFAKELHTLLQKTKIKSPYIVAGHSLGGFTVRVLAHEFPTEIAGVVLIDSMSPQQFTKEVMNAHKINSTQDISFLTYLAKFGIVRAATNLIGVLENATPEEKANYKISATPKSVQTFIDENEGLPESAFQASQITSLGEIPLIVLSRGIDDTENKKWSDMQKELLKLSSRSQQVIAQSSGHNIELEKPEAAVNAIQKMIKQVRIENNNTTSNK